MAIKGLVGGVNTSTTAITTSTNASSTTVQTSVDMPSESLVGALSEIPTSYSARITNTEAVPVEYSGSESDSMYIHVDNDTRTISGDVKWRSMLALSDDQEDTSHAYLASKAKANFESIEKELKELEATIQLLNKTCSTSTQTVSTYSKTVDEIAEKLKQLRDNLTAHQQTYARDNLIRESELTKLKSSFSSGKEWVQQHVAEKISPVNTTVELHTDAIDKVKRDLTAETDRAKTQETEISRDLDSVTRVTNQHTRDLNSVSQLVSAIDSRVHTLENSDTSETVSEHGQQIESLSQEISTVSNTLSSHVAGVSRETKRLSDVIYRHESDITNLTGKTEQLDSDFNELANSYSDLSITVNSIHTLQQDEVEQRNREYSSLLGLITGEADVRRTADTLHESELDRLDVRISDLQTDLTEVIQTFVDNLRARDRELEDKFTNLTFDFIDAGNAPI